MKKQQMEYQNSYIKEKYDRITMAFKKGSKEKYREYAESKGKSLNALIIELLENDMNGSQSETQTAGADTLELSAAVPTASEREECENLNDITEDYSDYDFKCSICNIDIFIDQSFNQTDKEIFAIKFCPKCGRRIKQ